MAYINCDCEEIEYACEDCIGEYERKCVKQHRKNKLAWDLANVGEILNCVNCEEVREICCKCNDIGCKSRLAGDPEQLATTILLYDGPATLEQKRDK